MAETNAQTIGEAILSSPHQHYPSTLWQKIANVELTQLTDVPVHPYEFVESWITELPIKENIIFRNRIAQIDGHVTLEELAKELGITRERVRQIEVRVWSKFESLAQETMASPIGWRIETLKQMIGIAAPLRDVEQLLYPEEGQTDFSTVFLKIAGPYDTTDDWIVLKSAAARDPTDRICMMADETGFVDEDLAERELTNWGLAQPYHREWLTRTGRIREFNGRLARWDGPIGDKLVTGLADLGHPATLDTLLDHIQAERARGTALNALSEERRVIRVNRTDWALRSWGREEYTGIADEIKQRIEQSGGAGEVDSIVRDIVEQFGVKQNSVLAYAAAPMFVIDGDRIRLRTDAEPLKVEETLEGCAGAYRSSERFMSLLIPVDADLLRGSGRALSWPFAAALGVSPGRPQSFLHAAGELKVTWPMTSAMGPSLGSTRTLATSVGATMGDRLRLDFELEQRCVNAERIPQELEAYEAKERIRLLTGITSDFSGVLEALSRAIDVPRSNVRPALLKRGDAELANLLPVPDVGPQLASTLSNLAKVITQR